MVRPWRSVARAHASSVNARQLALVVHVLHDGIRAQQRAGVSARDNADCSRWLRRRDRRPAHPENPRTLWRRLQCVLGQPIIFISAPAGPDTAAPPTIGLTAATGAFAAPQRIANSRHGKNRPDAGHGITRREDDRLRRCDALDHAGRGTRAVRRPRNAPRCTSTWCRSRTKYS